MVIIINYLSIYTRVIVLFEYILIYVDNVRNVRINVILPSSNRLYKKGSKFACPARTAALPAELSQRGLVTILILIKRTKYYGDDLQR